MCIYIKNKLLEKIYLHFGPDDKKKCHSYFSPDGPTPTDHTIHSSGMVNSKYEH